MTVFSAALLLSLHATAAEAPRPAVAIPPLDLALTYRGWLAALQAEEWDKAAAAVLPDDLADLKEKAIGQFRRSRPDNRLRMRLFNLGVESIEAVEAMSPREFFGAVASSGGGPLPGFLRAATVEVLEGGTEGDRGWLRVRLSVSARQGEVRHEQELRQEFQRVDGKWYVSLRSDGVPPAPAVETKGEPGGKTPDR